MGLNFVTVDLLFEPTSVQSFQCKIIIIMETNGAYKVTTCLIGSGFVIFEVLLAISTPRRH